ncbi:hypothetical protein DXG03_005073 [Asterophora parasitica]|uniref:F-box domain-containing protein n=1 Tax=Asterophora parasitica TaxID=117018 RepID=A0A9P7K7P5_9AGAR|nr:hypothetical protein DXG03_005073 [Asterophora parasitica]
MTDDAKLTVAALSDHQFLRRIQCLQLDMSIEAFVEMWRLVRPEDFVGLQALHLWVHYQNCYQDDSWPQSVLDGVFEVHQQWKDSSPFRLAVDLWEVTLTAATGLFVAAFLGAQFPWNQIVNLRVKIPNFKPLEKFHILQKCTPLEILKMDFDDDADFQFELSQHLHTLWLEREFPLNLAHALTTSRAWDNISLLHLNWARPPWGYDVYIILKHCPVLNTLLLSVRDFPVTQEPRDILSLPCLERINISYSVAHWLFRCILVPALEELCINTLDPADELFTVRDLVVKSQCPLTSFANDNYDAYHDNRKDVIEGTLELLKATPGLTKLRLRTVLPDKIVDEITSGDALPYLTHLNCVMISPRQVERMVRGRLEWEVATGGVGLEDVSVDVCEDDKAQIQAANVELKRMEGKYGVRLASMSVLRR